MAEGLLARLASILPGPVRRRLERGAQEALRHGGDVALVYHEVSKLAPDYYGMDLPYGEPLGYWLVRGGQCVRLPGPPRAGGIDVLEAIRRRRSRRLYSASPLSLIDVSALLYYTLGVTGKAWWGGPRRAYPSAGALQPLEGYLAAFRVEGLERGAYHYVPGRHCLEKTRDSIDEEKLAWAALDQEHVARAPAVLVLTAVYRRTASRYGLRAYRYVHWDVGFAGENVYLVAEALGLATVAVGAFYDDEICGLIGADCGEEIPMLIFPVGRRT